MKNNEIAEEESIPLPIALHRKKSSRESEKDKYFDK